MNQVARPPSQPAQGCLLSASPGLGGVGWACRAWGAVGGPASGKPRLGGVHRRGAHLECWGGWGWRWGGWVGWGGRGVQERLREETVRLSQLASDTRQRLIACKVCPPPPPKRHNGS